MYIFTISQKEVNFNNCNKKSTEYCAVNKYLSLSINSDSGFKYDFKDFVITGPHKCFEKVIEFSNLSFILRSSKGSKL